MATVGPEEFYITRQEEALYVAAGSTGAADTPRRRATRARYHYYARAVG